MVELTDQSAGAMRLYLLRGDVSMSQFTVLEHTTFTHGDIHIGIGILGESHFVRFKKEEELLHEVCTCTEVQIENPEQCIAHDFLPNLHTVPVSTILGGRTYAFTYTYEDWEHGTERLEALRKNMSDMHALSLKYVFPPYDLVHDEATTEVYAVLKNDIRIHSVHTYPNERVIVFTESRLAVAPD